MPELHDTTWIQSIGKGVKESLPSGNLGRKDKFPEDFMAVTQVGAEK